PPPTRMNAAEAKALRDSFKTAKAAFASDWGDAQAAFYSAARSQGIRSIRVPEPWETRYAECLTPPDDPAELSKVLERINARGRAEYEQRRIEDETWTREEASDWLFGADSRRRATEEEYQNFLAERLDETRKVYAWLPMSSETLLLDRGGEVTKFLHARWAREVGVDLQQMRKERKLFLNRVKRVAVLLDEAGPFQAQKQHPWYPACLDDLTASVRYRITMASGDITWASGFEVTDPIDSEDREKHAKALASHPECQAMTKHEVLEWLDQQIPRAVPRADKAWKNYCKLIDHPPREPLPRSRLPEILRAAGRQPKRPGVARANAKRARKAGDHGLQEAPSPHRVLI
ncbi:MAG: hypothetical protein AB7O66_24035, partial [Limisphaerales bacterium]